MNHHSKDEESIVVASLKSLWYNDYYQKRMKNHMPSLYCEEDLLEDFCKLCEKAHAEDLLSSEIVTALVDTIITEITTYELLEAKKLIGFVQRMLRENMALQKEHKPN